MNMKAKVIKTIDYIYIYKYHSESIDYALNKKDKKLTICKGGAWCE